MKQIKSLLIADILVLGEINTMNAQDKVAHVDFSEIMSKMREMIVDQNKIKK